MVRGDLIHVAGLFQIIVSCNRNPISMNRNACRKLVPVSLPSIVASATTHTTTPPGLMTRHNSAATPSKSHECPPYVRRLSYGGITIVTLSPCHQYQHAADAVAVPVVAP
jgi:hypothetical protein